VLISIGDHKTRKKDVVEKMFRQELTGEAMKKVEKKRMKEMNTNSTGTGGGVLEPLETGAESSSALPEVEVAPPVETTPEVKTT
jgi:hypothetical protein